MIATTYVKATNPTVKVVDSGRMLKISFNREIDPFELFIAVEEWNAVASAAQTAIMTALFAKAVKATDVDAELPGRYADAADDDLPF